MKILLIQAYMGGSEPAVFPVGLACIKSSLTGHQVRAFDTNTSQRPFEDLKSILLDFEPDVVGISLRNIDSTNKRIVVFYYSYLRVLLDTIKAYCTAKVIIGGSGFSMFANEIMEKESQIDFGVYLEGEAVFPRLLDNLDSPEQVPSVLYRKNGKVIFTGIAPSCDLNALPMPDWKLLPHSHYTAKDAIGIETKRGCPLGCIYCIYGFLNGKHYRLKNPKLVVDEIAHLFKKCGTRRFMFLDSVFNSPKSHSEAICHEILRRGIKVKWSAWFSEANLTEEYLDLVSKAGCDCVMLSPDALSDPVLKVLGKNFTRNDVLEAFRLLSQFHRFDVSYNFFKNPPGQTLVNFFSIVLFCLKAKWQMKRRVHFEFNSLRIEPYTQLYNIALRDGIISGGEKLLFPRYYINNKAWFIGAAFDLLLALKGK